MQNKDILAQNKGDSMIFGESNPYVRYVRYLSIKNLKQTSMELTPLDNRLFYVYKDTAIFEIDGQTVLAPAGSVLYIHSGISYTFLPCDALCIAVNFDFTQNNKHLTTPIPPAHSWETPRLVESENFSDYAFLNSYLLLNNCQQIEELLKASEKEYIMRLPLYEHKISLMMKEVLISIIRKNELAGSDECRFDAEKIADYLRKNLAEPLDNTYLAEKFHFHPNYLSSQFAKYFGKPIHKYILEMRILKAISLLESGNDNIALIAQSVGFPDSNYFSRYFKKIMGVSPKAYLKKR